MPVAQRARPRSCVGRPSSSLHTCGPRGSAELDSPARDHLMYPNCEFFPRASWSHKNSTRKEIVGVIALIAAMTARRSVRRSHGSDFSMYLRSAAKTQPHRERMSNGC
jgi:hypothetical protein